jgi:hypothetical protein
VRVKEAHAADNPADTAYLSSLLPVTGFCAAPGGLGVLHDLDHLGWAGKRRAKGADGVRGPPPPPHMHHTRFTYGDYPMKGSAELKWRRRIEFRTPSDRGVLSG